MKKYTLPSPCCHRLPDVIKVHHLFGADRINNILAF